MNTLEGLLALHTLRTRLIKLARSPIEQYQREHKNDARRNQAARLQLDNVTIHPNQYFRHVDPPSLSLPGRALSPPLISRFARQFRFIRRLARQNKRLAQIAFTALARHRQQAMDPLKYGLAARTLEIRAIEFVGSAIQKNHCEQQNDASRNEPARLEFNDVGMHPG